MAEPTVPWTEARKDPEKLKLVQAHKALLSAQLKKWGQENGIADLSLQHIMTMAKNPDAPVSYYWNPNKSEWFRYRKGDDVPRWLENLPNRNSYKHPNGSALTPEILAKFKGRGSGSTGKLTSLD